MHAFRTVRVVKHSPAEMFDLVADVERYPEFVPLCERLVVRSRQTLENSVQSMVASMTVGYGPINETFTTRVRLERPALRIMTSNVEGPFRHLENEWRFEPHPDGCRVSFAIEYAFRSFTLEILVGALFDKAFRKFAQAFEARADVMYGPPEAPALTRA
jgi:coenzyme Q-binding protein COQ10